MCFCCFVQLWWNAFSFNQATVGQHYLLPFDFVAYAFTILSDNLSWNSCIWEAWHNRALTQAILWGQYSWLEIKTHCPVFVCFLQTSIVVLFREMSRKMTMPCSNLLTIKYVGLIWFVHQLHIVKITSIKLLTYKVTVKHFICTHNIIFEFCHNKTKQCSNEEPKEMPLRVQ